MAAARTHEIITSQPTTEPGFHNIAVFVDGSVADKVVIPHALAIARAFGGRVTLLRVIESQQPTDAPADPLDWDIRRREAHQHLDQLVRERSADASITAEVIEGCGAEQIHKWAQHHNIDLMVIGSQEAEGAGWTLANDARTLLDQAQGSVLVVHSPVITHPSVGRYQRVLVPVDGSSRAESVLPLAVRVAGSTAAELLVAHVVPGAGLTEIGPLDSEDVDLRERITRRNARVAAAYLDRVRAGLTAVDVPLRMMVLHDGDVRTHLGRLIADEAVDLVVLSSHGHSARTSVPYGSVTADLIAHTPVPLLIVRPRTAHTPLTMASATLRGRLPHQAAS